mmetsp:Transcript_34900/g.65083  ORF Transcript_34900/g.65083 Transcript_34900/m.65083 type:complete len:107 (-) Transcript_34900:229-549(-)
MQIQMPLPNCLKTMLPKFCGTVTSPADRFGDNWALLQAWVGTPDRQYITKKHGARSGSDMNNKANEPGDDDIDGRGAAAGGTDSTTTARPDIDLTLKVQFALKHSQ